MSGWVKNIPGVLKLHSTPRLTESKQVCGMMKGPPRHKKTWWWNKDVEDVVANDTAYKWWSCYNGFKLL